MIAQARSTSVKQTAGEPGPLVYVIDDDEAICLALESLLRSAGLSAMTFTSTQAFLAHGTASGPSCLILDVRLRGESGLEFQDALARNNLHMPIVFVTGYGDIAMTVKAMKAGAQDFLAKPFRDQDVLDAVSHALARDRERLNAEHSLSSLRALYDTLTPREREVTGYVLAGLLNKQIASEMNVTEVTVKMHRGQVMKKMGARSIADLVRRAQSIDVQPCFMKKT